jgi:hypothetical protein
MQAPWPLNDWVAPASFDFAQDKPCRLARELALSLPKGRFALGAAAGDARRTAAETAALPSAARGTLRCLHRFWSHRFCSHQRLRTNNDHGRDHEVSPAMKRVHTSRTAVALIEV